MASVRMVKTLIHGSQYPPRAQTLRVVFSRHRLQLNTVRRRKRPPQQKALSQSSPRQTRGGDLGENVLR
eukprot:229711-Amphidinium_carterae.2